MAIEAEVRTLLKGLIASYQLGKKKEFGLIQVKFSAKLNKLREADPKKAEQITRTYEKLIARDAKAQMRARAKKTTPKAKKPRRRI